MKELNHLKGKPQRPRNTAEWETKEIAGCDRWALCAYGCVNRVPTQSRGIESALHNVCLWLYI
ncbi:Uncharacterized protein APZ42_011568 [Daphnia magna]|uniref:Uncharacterized protein n=1 Tax=Daphnia magna TaxID=35525 RepID=A0A162CZE7_9CRUS|nr:Uncharacterized protein APZ42_011568 [Daphnia magna]